MNGKRLFNTLSKNIATKKTFVGVFASDQLPYYIHRYPHSFVANTDPKKREGEHWVSLWIENPSKAEYFCSLGEPPNANLQRYLEKFKCVQVNNRQIQAFSENTCGHYCIYFLVSRASRQTFAQIMQTLWRTRALADWLVKHFVRLLFK